MMSKFSANFGRDQASAHLIDTRCSARESPPQCSMWHGAPYGSLTPRWTPHTGPLGGEGARPRRLLACAASPQSFQSGATACACLTSAAALFTAGPGLGPAPPLDEACVITRGAVQHVFEKRNCLVALPSCCNGQAGSLWVGTPGPCASSSARGDRIAACESNEGEVVRRAGSL